MLIEKIIPVGSDLYSVWSGYFSELGKKIDSQGWVQLFFNLDTYSWGIVLSMDLSDRYIYWEWSGWIEGLYKTFYSINCIYFHSQTKCNMDCWDKKIKYKRVSNSYCYWEYSGSIWIN